MRAACFPFTCLDEGLLKIISVCFDTIDLYLPSAAGIPDRDRYGNLLVHVPDDTMDQQVETIYRACIQWREATRGAAASFFKAGRIPFFDENSTSIIRRELAGDRLRDADRNPAPLLHARVFLRLAADHDERQAEVDRSLELLRNKEKQMFTSIQGNDESEPSEIPAAATKTVDRGAAMTSARLAAWSTLALAAGFNADMLVTDSRAVLDHINSTLPGSHIPIDQSLISMSAPATAVRSSQQWDRFWKDCLSMTAAEAPSESIATALSDTSGPLDARLTLLVCPDISPGELLTTFAGRDDLNPSLGRQEPVTGTLIACFRPF